MIERQKKLDGKCVDWSRKITKDRKVSANADIRKNKTEVTD